MKKRQILILLLLFAFTFAVYKLTSGGKTPYDYFVRLADAFIQGKYYLTEKPSYLTELIPQGSNKFFVVYPPMPAILLIPFVLFFGKNFPQELISQILGAGIGVLTFLIATQLKKDIRLAVYSYLLICLGTIVWFLSSVGSSWYLGQITGAFFLTFAIYEVLSRKRPFIVGLLVGAAYLARIHTIISLPFFLYSLKEKLNFKNLLHLFLGILIFVSFNFFYNFIRFGTIFDKGYFILPKVLNEESVPWFAKGVASPTYIKENLRVAFFSMPKFLDKPPFVQPSWGGLAIWITTPAFIFALFASLKDRINLFAWLAALSIFGVVASHGGTGWAQFGYRFAVDLYPFLMFLTIKGIIKQNGPKWFHWLLLFVGILVNLWGVLWINKFDWVGW